MMDYVYILIALVAVGCSFRGPRWGIAALAVTLPLSRRFPALPIPLLNTQNILVLVALISMIMKPRDKTAGAGLRFAVPLLMFTALATMAFANTMLFFMPTRYFFMWDPTSILINFKNLLTCLLIYVLGSYVASSRENIEVVLKGLMVGMAFEGAFVCMEVLLIGPGRANGHLNEGNSAGAYLAGSFAAAAGVFLVMKLKSLLGTVALGTTLASAAGLVFTQSRGNWIAGILAGGGITLLRDRRALLVLVVLLCSYQLWLPQSALDRIDTSFTTSDKEPWRYRVREGSDESMAIGGLQSRLIGAGESDEEEGDEVAGEESGEARLDSSSQVRLYVWNAGLRMLSDYPLGVGYGVFPFQLGYYSDVVKFKAAHNSYLQIACELGIHGLFAFLLFMACLFYEATRGYLAATDPLLKGLCLAALGTGIAMMVSAIFYNFFFVIEINGQQWLLLGLSTQVRRVLKLKPIPQAELAAGKPEAVPLYRMVT